MTRDIDIQPATEADVPLILQLIRALAEYERLAHEVVATEAMVRESFFGASPHAQAVIARAGGSAVGFAIWFSTYSTFLSKPGIYLEDLFVLPEWRGKGIGRALLRHLARIAVERRCGRIEWSVLDWNETAIGFYKRIGADVLPDWRTCRMSREAIAQLADSK